MTENNGPGKSNFSSQHDDINLTKEETEFLEAQFLKYLSREMEKNSSNWGQFYDILKEETVSDGSRTSQENLSSKCKFSPSQDESTENSKKQNSTSNGFKVNTERTKQQYRSSHDEKQNWNRTREPPPPQADNNFNNNTSYCPDQKTSSFNREDDERSKRNNSTKGKKGKSQKKNEDSEKPCGKRKSVPKQTKQQQQQQQQHNQQKNEEKENSGSSPDDVEESSPGRKVLRIMKEVLIIFACFAIMIIFFALKFCWNIGKRILRYSLWVVLFILSRLLGFLMELNRKYQIIPKFFTVSNNLLELCHLVLGINIKAWFKRWGNKNAKSKIGGVSGPPPELPTTSEDAIKFLLNENPEKPYRILCASHTDDVEKLRNHYRKLVRLVHPDKCNLPNAEESFKILDTAFKKLTDPEKREELNTEIERQRAWEEFNQHMGEDYKKMFEEMLITIQCSVCEKRHKKNLVKDRNFFKARYCAECNTRHSAQDGDVWAEVGMLGINWTCYACFDGEVFELTQWGRCQGLNKALPVNSHRIFCQLGTRSSAPANGRTRKSKDHPHDESGSGRSRGGGGGGRNKKSKKKR